MTHLPAGRITVEIYERDPESLESVKRSEDVQVLAVVLSYGDHRVQVSMDEERNTWEIEVIGESVTYHV